MINHFDKKELAKLTTYFIPFLIFVGSLRLILFYRLFDISIVDYLDFSEVLISFLDTAIFYLFALFIPIFIILSFWGEAMGRQSNIDFAKKAELTFGQRLKGDIKQNFILVLLYTTVFFFIIFKGTWTLQGFLLLLLNPGLFIILFIVRELRIAYKRQFNYSIPVTYINLFLLSYLFIVVVIQNVLSDVQDITKKYKYYGTTVFVGNDIIKSDSTITYIGQTKNYLFFNNLLKKENIIYPKTNLKKLIVVKK
ncbi:MAG: hypothetical protein JSR09_05875 [Bacteroidetes bacterium]|nr:hypothetical protein [Bacteroidota bacterium]